MFLPSYIILVWC